MIIQHITHKLFPFFMAGAFSLGLGLSSCKTTSKSTSSTPTKTKELTHYDRRKFDYLYFEGLKEKMLGNYAEALEKFGRCVQMDPSASAPNYEIATILHNTGRAEEAIPYAKKAVALDPSNPWYLQLSAECYRTAGNASEAALIYEKGIKTFPNRKDFYFELGELYLLTGKYEKAIQVYNKLEEKTGVYEDLSITKQKIWLKLGNVEKAVAEIQKLCDRFPSEPRYLLIIGNILSKSGDNNCLNYFNKAIQLAPLSGIPHLYLHDHYLSRKENVRAFSELKMAFQSSDVSIDSKTKILLEYYERTAKDSSLIPQADTLMKIVQEVNSTDARTFTVIGDFYFRDKKYRESYDAFRKALELDRSKYAIWYQVMVLQSQLDLYPEMKTAAVEAMELFPNEPAPYLFLSLVLLQEKNHKDAIGHLKTGKELVIENPELLLQFYSYLGEAYHKEQDYKNSDISFDKALSYDPKNATVLNNYAYFLSLRNTQLEKAEKMSRLANELETSSASYQDTYAWIFYKMGRYAEAKVWLEKAMMNGGSSNANVLEHYGDVLYRQGETTKAVQFWESAKKLGKGSDFLDKKLVEKKLFE